MEKIAVIGSAYPYRGGLAAFNERLATEFIRQGFPTTIHTFTLQYPGFLFPGKTQYSEDPAPVELNIRRSVNSVNPFNWSRAARKIRRENPDLAIVKYWLPFMAPSLGTIARKIRKGGTSVICIADNIVPHEKRPGDAMLTRYFVNSVDGFIVMSSQVEKELKMARPGLPYRINPHPLFDNFGEAIPKTLARKELGLDETGPLMLFFGFIREYKGLDLLLEAMSDERLRQLPVNLLVAGEFYTDASPYLRLIHDLGLEDRVFLHDRFINDSEVSRYFCAADLVVQPYRHATQSGVTQIAYHFNKPMVVTAVGGLPELVPDGVAGFVTETDPGAIAAAIADFFLEGKEAIFVHNIEIEKQKFAWSGMTRSILDLYREIK